MNIKRAFVMLSTAGLMLLALTPQNGARADDIDIYVDPVTNAAEAPMVMFSIEYAPNTGATICQTGACPPNIVALHTHGHMVENPATTKIEHFMMLRGVLNKFIKSLKGVKIGLMFPHDDTCTGSVKSGPTADKCSNGGYFLHGFKLMQEGDGNGNKAAIKSTLNAMPVPQGGLSHKYQGKEMFFEFYRYLSGRAWYNGHNGWNDYATLNNLNLDSEADSAYNAGLNLKWDAAIESGANYISPITDATKCAKIYTVNILGDQIAAGVDSQSDTAIKATIANGGIPGIPQVNNLSFNQVLKALFLNDVSPVEGKQTVTSYFVVNEGKINTATRSYAGGGIGVGSAEPYALTENPDKLIGILEQIFRNILSISTTFVAPTVAVNVYNRAQVLDDIFIAMFQAPDPMKPLWPGNLKKYTLGTNLASGEREIQDATGAFAVDPAKGRIKAEALSLWTYPAALPKPAADELEFTAGKDGRGVDRGGAGSKIPGFRLKCVPDNASDPDCHPGDESPGLTNPAAATNTTNTTARKVFYDKVDGATTTLADLNANVATATALHGNFSGNVIGDCSAADAVANPSSTCNLLIYARGGEYVDHDNNAGTANVLRGRNWVENGWILGDLLHSRPLAVNYGARSGYSTDNPDVRLIAGSNDGLMHMFRNTAAGLTAPPTPNASDGVETWAFMPREVMPVVKKLKSGVGPPIHPYTMDGSPVVFISDVDGDGNIETGDDKVWLFFGMRRGGKSIYALNITNPDNPTFMWKITQGPGDFAQLGQTWSTPQVGYMLFDGSQTARPVLIFGGGYNPNKDTHPGHTNAAGPITETLKGSNDTDGNAFFIVNAETGELVWKAIQGNGAATAKVFQHPDLTDSIPSEVTAVDSNGNQLIDRAYFGDTGGRLWRADLYCHNQDGATCPSFCQNADGSPCSTTGWKVTPLLSVGRHVSLEFDNLTNDRRFFNAPDFARTKDGTGRFDAIIIGSGDREAPKDTAVKNWFYMYKDRYIQTNSIPDAFTTVVHNDLGDVSDDCLQTGTCGASSPNLAKGWKMRLHCQLGGTFDNTCGEKNLAPALTLGGTIFFTTYIPAGASGAACTLPEGSGLFYEVSLQEGFAVEDLFAGNGATKDWRDRATLLASGGIPAEAVSIGGGDLLRPDLKVTPAPARTVFKAFWYEKYLK